MKTRERNESTLIIGCIILVCFSFYFFFNSMKKHKEAAILEGENNILKKEKEQLKDSLQKAAHYSDSITAAFLTWQDSIKNNQSKFNEKLHTKVRAALHATDSAAIREFSDRLAAERREIIE